MEALLWVCRWFIGGEPAQGDSGYLFLTEYAAKLLLQAASDRPHSSLSGWRRLWWGRKIPGWVRSPLWSFFWSQSQVTPMSTSLPWEHFFSGEAHHASLSVSKHPSKAIPPVCQEGGLFMGLLLCRARKESGCISGGIAAATSQARLGWLVYSLAGLAASWRQLPLRRSCLYTGK